MALGDNTALFTTVTENNIVNNGLADEVGDFSNEATAFKFSNGNSGDKKIVDFDKNDSIVNYQKIFDGNNDGIIDFGANGILDIDRTSRSAPGSDQITLQPFEGGTKALRYLGEKQGWHVYADASVRLAGLKEGTVGNDTFDAAGGNFKYLYDTALGFNLGGDTIKNFGVGDEIVTTTKIHNGADAGALITFGNNGVLDLPGDHDGIKGDIGPSEGGQIDFGGPLTLALLSTENNANGVTYYHYGLAVA
ncbi:hypothetical protein BV96_03986 [Sphingomonas paucimobilis]|nr:hypothetical protein BV96_03986 [Sphingomonas paucimobilis]